MKTIIARVAAGALVLVVLGVALSTLHRALSHVRYRDVVAEVKALPPPRLLLAVALTAASYLVIGLYDRLALRYARRPQRFGTSALVGFIATAVSNTVGFSLLSGGSIRYHFYSAAGLEAADTAKVVGFVSATFWLGFLAVGGVVLTLTPPGLPAGAAWPLGSLRLLGVVFLAVVTGYAGLALARRGRVFEVRGVALRVPDAREAAAQIVVASADWLLAGGTLVVLLSGMGLPPGEVLAVFFLAQIAGLVSHLPGGLGVFESIFILFFSSRVSASSLVGALLGFRAIYYLLPFAAAVVTLVSLEVAHRRQILAGVLSAAGRWVTAVVPAVFALAAFGAGTLLLASGATPAIAGRAGLAGRLLGLPVMEVSHLSASVVGVLLLLLSRGLQRRLDGAYFLTLCLLAAGAAFSLLKALDWEEALLLAAIALALAPFRRAFYRRTSLLAQRFSARWLTAIGSVLAGTTWLGFFAHKHVEYSSQLWWRFAVHGDAPRFLRATVAVAVVVVLFSLARLLSGARPRRKPPTAVDMAAARKAIARSPETMAHLALTGDKSFLFNDDRTAFVMYGHAGRSFIAMGDPIGPPEDRRELAWRFHELADRYGAYTVFYEVSAENLPVYLDLGLQLQKLGEEAVVDLRDFSLEGGKRKGLRASFNRLEKEGVRFELVEPEAVPPLMATLEHVSDAWLAGKNTREKSFSLGGFDGRYLEACPIALLWQGDRLLAFANLWRGADRRELSVDLMRYLPDAPAGTMEHLFVRIMLWGREHGFATFNLGMAPLSGFAAHPLLPIWGKLASLLYRHGEHFYNFRGLRGYKEKFRPRWQPKYLASPGGLALPLVVANVASLVSSGVVGVVAKPRHRRGKARAPGGSRAQQVQSPHSGRSHVADPHSVHDGAAGRRG